VSARERNDSAARVRIPADVEREDRLLANLTARQLAILGLGGIVLWAAYDATRHVVPVAVFAAAATPVAALAVLLALGRVGGMPADRLVWAAWRQWRSPSRLVPAPEGVPAVPGFVPGLVGAPAAPLPAPPLPAPLRLPMMAIDDDGLIDLGADGLAVVCRASAVSFSLRTPAEQEALVAGFGRYLNSLSDPAQVLVRAEPFDLAPVIGELEHTAPGLPHPGLEEAAREHARFLGDLAATRDLLRREVLVVLRQPSESGAAAAGASDRLRRRAEEAKAALAAAGVALDVLGGPEAGACLTRALDPTALLRPAGLSSSSDVVTGRIGTPVHDTDGNRLGGGL
jgi:hypothetical protein